MTIAEAQQKVDEWINTTGVRYFNELTNMAMLTEEVGEVARIIARKYGEQSMKKSEEEKNLADELADVDQFVQAHHGRAGRGPAGEGDDRGAGQDERLPPDSGSREARDYLKFGDCTVPANCTTPPIASALNIWSLPE